MSRTPTRIVFMGTPEFSVPTLEVLHREAQVVAVYAQPDRPAGRGLGEKAPPVKVKALELGLPVFQPQKLTLPGEFEKLQALNPDLIVVVAYGQILRQNVLSLPRLGCVNIHSSLLPRWRGAAPIQWAILDGDDETGVTTMRMAEKLDAGDILLQTRTPIHPEDTAGSVHDRLARLGAGLMIQTLRGLEEGTLKDTRQDETQVSYASKLTKEMEALDPVQEPAVSLDRKIRALNPWPGTSLWVGKDRLKIKKARLHEDIAGTLGAIFEKNGMLLLGASGGALELLEVQWDGKKATGPSEFLNGLRGRGQTLPLRVSSTSS